MALKEIQSLREVSGFEENHLSERMAWRLRRHSRSLLTGQVEPAAEEKIPRGTHDKKIRNPTILLYAPTQKKIETDEGDRRREKNGSIWGGNEETVADERSRPGAGRLQINTEGKVNAEKPREIAAGVRRISWANNGRRIIVVPGEGDKGRPSSSVKAARDGNFGDNPMGKSASQGGKKEDMSKGPTGLAVLGRYLQLLLVVAGNRGNHNECSTGNEMTFDHRVRGRHALATIPLGK